MNLILFLILGMIAYSIVLYFIEKSICQQTNKNLLENLKELDEKKGCDFDADMEAQDYDVFGKNKI